MLDGEKGDVANKQLKKLQLIFILGKPKQGKGQRLSMELRRNMKSSRSNTQKAFNNVNILAGKSIGGKNINKLKVLSLDQKGNIGSWIKEFKAGFLSIIPVNRRWRKEWCILKSDGELEFLVGKSLRETYWYRETFPLWNFWRRVITPVEVPVNSISLSVGAQILQWCKYLSRGPGAWTQVDESICCSVAKPSGPNGTRGKFSNRISKEM